MNAYQKVTEHIIKRLEAGTVPWRQPWAGASAPQNLASGNRYHGINRLILGSMGFSDPYFMTFRQARDKGGTVRKGEHGLPVVYCGSFVPKDKRGDKPKPTLSGDDPDAVRFLKYSTVFHVGQIDGIEAPDVETRENRPIMACDAVYYGMPDRPQLRHGGGRACYSPTLDTVSMPEPERFADAAAYYATLFHELTHATGHKARLARTNFAGTFGSETYGKEELIAEMGAAFLCAETGISPTTLEQSAAYIAGWLRTLRKPGNVRMIVSAAAQAEKASKYVLGSVEVKAVA